MGTDLVVDDEGSVLVVGRRGGLDLDRDGSIDVRTHGSPDALILKHRGDTLGPWRERASTGALLSWVADCGSAEDDHASGVASDGRGGAYGVGTFAGEMSFSSKTVTATGKTDGFLVRYDRDGSPVWAKAIGGAGQDDLIDVVSDAKGNLYVVGSFRGKVDLDGDGSADLSTERESAMLLASFTREGELRWAVSSNSDAAVTGRTVAVGPGGEVYAGGLYRNGSFDLDGDGELDGPTAPPASAGGRSSGPPDLNAFYARFDAGGRMQWARTVSGPGVQAVGMLSVLDSGDLLVLGGSMDDADLDGDGATDLKFKSLDKGRLEHFPDGAAFLLRTSPEGKPRWHRRLMAYPTHLSSRGKTIVVSGYYNDALDLDDDGKPERAADADKRQEGFVGLFDDGGNLQRVFTIVGRDADAANAAGISPDGRTLWVTGYNKLEADFDGDGQIETASKCHQIGDFFLARYRIR